MQQVVTCTNCQGQGRLYTTPCAACQGQGIIEREEQIAITIPIGIEEGMVLRVPGQGLLSRDLQGVPGDLFVILHIASDDRFERRGIDLWQYVTLSVEDCVLGTQVDIPTLQEPFTLDVPEKKAKLFIGVRESIFRLQPLNRKFHAMDKGGNIAARDPSGFNTI